MTLEFQKQDVLQLSDFNLAHSRFKVGGGRATRTSPLRCDNRLEFLYRFLPSAGKLTALWLRKINLVKKFLSRFLISGNIKIN